MDLPFLLGGHQRLLFGMSSPFPELAFVVVAVVVPLVFLWWVRHTTGEREYRSFRATSHGGSRQALIAVGVTMSVAAALILIAPLIARLIRA